MKKTNNSERKKKKKEERDPGKFWIMIFLVVMFITSLFGFAISMSSSNSRSSNNIPFSIHYDQYNRPIYYQKYNGVLFFYHKDYPNIKLNNTIKSIAKEVKKDSFVKIYNTQKYYDSLFILEKALKAKGINFAITNDNSCNNQNKVILSQDKLKGNCINFYGNDSQVYYNVEELVYKLLNT